MAGVGTLIVDTDVLSDYLNGEKEAVKLLEYYRNKGEISTTDINIFELYYGAYKSESSGENLTALKGFLRKIPVYSTSNESMELAGKMAAEQEEKGERIGLKDTLIGSIAAIENQKVITRNISEFERLSGVKTVDLEPEEET